MAAACRDLAGITLNEGDLVFRNTQLRLTIGLTLLLLTRALPASSQSYAVEILDPLTNASAASQVNGLFGTGDLGECEDAVDANDDGSIDVADGVTILNTLFGGGAPLPAPSGVCGDDLTDDGLFCAEHDACLLE